MHFLPIPGCHARLLQHIRHVLCSCITWWMSGISQLVWVLASSAISRRCCCSYLLVNTGQKRKFHGLLNDLHAMWNVLRMPFFGDCNWHNFTLGQFWTQMLVAVTVTIHCWRKWLPNGKALHLSVVLEGKKPFDWKCITSTCFTVFLKRLLPSNNVLHSLEKCMTLVWGKASGKSQCISLQHAWTVQKDGITFLKWKTAGFTQKGF